MSVCLFMYDICIRVCIENEFILRCYCYASHATYLLKGPCPPVCKYSDLIGYTFCRHSRVVINIGNLVKRISLC